MADNIDLVNQPASLNLATDELTHSGDTAQVQVVHAYEVTGAEGSKTHTAVAYSTLYGAVTETAPATDIASSGLNGRLQRVAQRLTSLIALIPAALGANGGLKVDIVGDTGTPSTLDTDDGTVAAAQASVALTIPLRYTWNGQAWTRGGFTPHAAISAASTNATVVKASAGVIGYIAVSNINAAARYLKLYNKATSPTVGTDVPVATFVIPGNAAGGGTNIPIPDVGMSFSTGISYALTTGITVADTGPVGASELSVALGWL